MGERGEMLEDADLGERFRVAVAEDSWLVAWLRTAPAWALALAALGATAAYVAFPSLFLLTGFDVGEPVFFFALLLGAGVLGAASPAGWRAGPWGFAGMAALALAGAVLLSGLTMSMPTCVAFLSATLPGADAQAALAAIWVVCLVYFFVLYVLLATAVGLLLGMSGMLVRFSRSGSAVLGFFCVCAVCAVVTAALSLSNRSESFFLHALSHLGPFLFFLFLLLAVRRGWAPLARWPRGPLRPRPAAVAVTAALALAAAACAVVWLQGLDGSGSSASSLFVTGVLDAAAQLAQAESQGSYSPGALLGLPAPEPPDDAALMLSACAPAVVACLLACLSSRARPRAGALAGSALAGLACVGLYESAALFAWRFSYLFADFGAFEGFVHALCLVALPLCLAACVLLSARLALRRPRADGGGEAAQEG